MDNNKQSRYIIEQLAELRDLLIVIERSGDTAPDILYKLAIEKSQKITQLIEQRCQEVAPSPVVIPQEYDEWLDDNTTTDNSADVSVEVIDAMLGEIPAVTMELEDEEDSDELHCPQPEVEVMELPHSDDECTTHMTEDNFIPSLIDESVEDEPVCEDVDAEVVPHDHEPMNEEMPEEEIQQPCEMDNETHETHDAEDVDISVIDIPEDASELPLENWAAVISDDMALCIEDEPCDDDAACEPDACDNEETADTAHATECSNDVTEDEVATSDEPEVAYEDNDDTEDDDAAGDSTEDEDTDESFYNRGEPLESESLTVGEMMSMRQARELRKALSLNDRFRFRRELFGNSDINMNDTLNLIDTMNDYNEACEYLMQDLGWSIDEPVVQEFLKLVELHFKQK